MNRSFKNILLLSILTTILHSPSYGDVEPWVSIVDTQNIDPDETLQAIELTEATEIEQQVFTLISKINYIKIQMESIKDQLDKNEITKDKYESLHKKYSGEYHDLAKDLKLVSVGPAIITTNNSEIPKVEIVNGILIDSSDKLLKDSLPKEKYEVIKVQLGKLDDKLLNQQISKDDYLISINNLVDDVSVVTQNTLENNINYVEIKPLEIKPASLEKLYTNENIKKSILMLQDLLSKGKISNEQYDKKLDFFKTKLKQY